MNLDLTGKNAIVCGSTQGLGYAAAIELALLGAGVTLVARNEEKLKLALQKLDTSKGQTHHYVVADFSLPEQVKSAIDRHLTKHSPVNILVNNTGGPPGGPAITAAPEEFIAAFNMHLICNHIIVQAVVPGMKTSGYGRIVNMISSSVKQPIADLGVSNTIRSAVANWSKTLAGELGRFGITVNNVLPGFMQTARLDHLIAARAEKSGASKVDITNRMIAEIPAGRIGEPQEFGAAIAFLCSPAAAYINGINLPVDGGKLGTL